MKTRSTLILTSIALAALLAATIPSVVRSQQQPPPPPAPPQAEKSPNATKAATNSSNCKPRRRLFQPIRHRATASTVVGKNGSESRRRLAACALAEIVSCVVAAPPDGVTVVGLKEQLAPLGSPEQAKPTVELNPFCGVTVSVTDP